MKHVFKITATLIACIVALSSSLALGNINQQQAEIQALIVKEANRQNFPPALALAVARVESNFNPSAKSHAGARGVMQIMPATAEQDLGVPRRKLYDPEINIEAGIRFLDQLIQTYDGRWDIALSHYNGGSAVTNRWGRLRVIPATRNYVDQVLAHTKRYEKTLVSYSRLLEDPSREGVQHRKNLDDFQPGGLLDGWQRRQDQSKQMSAHRARLVSSLKDLADRNHKRGIGSSATHYHNW